MPDSRKNQFVEQFLSLVRIFLLKNAFARQAIFL